MKAEPNWQVLQTELHASALAKDTNSRCENQLQGENSLFFYKALAFFRPDIVPSFNSIYSLVENIKNFDKVIHATRPH